MLYVCLCFIHEKSNVFFAFPIRTSFYLLGGNITLLRICGLESSWTVGFVLGTCWNWLIVAACLEAKLGSEDYRLISDVCHGHGMGC